MILAFSALLYTKQKSHSLEQMHMYKERDSLFELPLPYPFFDGVDEYISICWQREANPEGLLHRHHILIQIHLQRWRHRNHPSSPTQPSDLSSPVPGSDHKRRRRSFQSSGSLKKRHSWSERMWTPELVNFETVSRKRGGRWRVRNLWSTWIHMGPSFSWNSLPFLFYYNLTRVLYFQLQLKISSPNWTWMSLHKERVPCINIKGC